MGIYLSFQQGNAHHLSGTGRLTSKIGKLVDQALTKAWTVAGNSSMTIVRNMVKWGNFLPVWKFYSEFYVILLRFFFVNFTVYVH